MAGKTKPMSQIKQLLRLIKLDYPNKWLNPAFGASRRSGYYLLFQFIYFKSFINCFNFLNTCSL